LGGHGDIVASVKFRHAAALAAIGWYMIAPPVTRDTSNEPSALIGRSHADLSAPLSTWRIVKSFDSARDCEKRLAEENSNAKNFAWLGLRTKEMNDQASAGAGWMPQDVLEEITNQHCVASDDPRLAK